MILALDIGGNTYGWPVGGEVRAARASKPAVSPASQPLKNSEWAAAAGVRRRNSSVIPAVFPPRYLGGCFLNGLISSPLKSRRRRKESLTYTLETEEI